MRLTALFLTVLTVILGNNAPNQDVSGLWVADLTKSDLGAVSRPTLLILNVTRNGSDLKVIEMVKDEVGAYAAERLYVFKGAAPRGEKEVGTAETHGHETVLRSSGRLERWGISDGCCQLVVSRWIGDSPAAPQQKLILRRSSWNVE